MEIALLLGRADAELDHGRALALLERARALAADDPETGRKTGIELVRRRLAAGDLRGARSLAAALLARSSEDPEVLVAAARADEAVGDAESAWRRLRAVEESRLTPAGRTLRRRVALRVLCDDRLRLARDPAALARTIEELEQAAGDDPELRMEVASALAAARLHHAARRIAREVLGRPTATATAGALGARLRAAGILLGGGPAEEQALKEALDRLQRERGLDLGQRAHLGAIERGLAVRQADRWREEGRFDQAAAALQLHLLGERTDPTVLAALARLLAAAGEDEKASALYAQLLRAHPHNVDLIVEAAANAWSRGDERSARELAEDALVRFPDHPGAYLVSGRQTAARGDWASAYQLLHHGLTLAEGAEGAAGERPSTTDRLVEDATVELGSGERRQAAAGPGDAVASALAEEADRVDERVAPTLQGGLVFRFRSGDSGLGRVFELNFPTSFQLSPRKYGFLQFVAMPVYLNAGSLSLSDPAIAGQIGTLALAAPDPSVASFDNQAGGVALSLRYEYRGLVAEIGSTPLGFLVPDAIATAGWTGQFGHFSIGVVAFRQAVTDSLLAYGGRRDPVRGEVWGGVRRMGGQINLGYSATRFALRGYASYASYLGRHVASNHGGHYGLEGLWHFYRRVPDRLSVGLAFRAMNFGLNLRHFTFGQGGYFSPQLLFAAGAPLRWRRETPALIVDLEAVIGVVWYREDRSPVFPLDPSLQAAVAQRTAGSDGPIVGGQFPGDDRLGPWGGLNLAVRHRVAPHLYLVETLGGQFATAYSEVVAGLSLSGGFL